MLISFYTFGASPRVPVATCCTEERAAWMSASIATAGDVRSRQEPDRAAARFCLTGEPPFSLPCPPAARSLAARLSTLCSALRSSSLMICPHVRNKAVRQLKGILFVRTAALTQHCIQHELLLEIMLTHTQDSAGARQPTSTEQKGWDSRLSRCGARTRSPVRL